MKSLRILAAWSAIAILGSTAGCRRDHDDRIVSPQSVELDLPVTRVDATTGEPGPVLDLLEKQIDENLTRLQDEQLEIPAYFLAYELVARRQLWLEAQSGALIKEHRDANRTVDVDLRVGTPGLDNSHTRDGSYGGRGLGTGLAISVDDEELSLAQALWMITDQQFRDAVSAFRQEESSDLMRTDEGETKRHPDFSKEKPLVSIQAQPDLDLEALQKRWRPVVTAASKILGGHEHVLESTVALQATVEHRSLVNSEGSRVQDARVRLRLMLLAVGQAEDGMELERFRSFEVHRPEQLPSVEVVEEAARQLQKELLALRQAPIAEPYTGPAVLEGPAAGVFFHEIFGHRLEGHRQKNDQEGQTFTRKLGKEILPRFLDVIDDPTIVTLAGTPLNGHYLVDNEAVASRPAVLVKEGRLRGYLLDRSPVLPFRKSNGHGRREPGHQIVPRQGNLIVNARKTVPEQQLRQALIAKAKRQGKPYGLWFRDIQGGYTITERSGPQAFKVFPLMVYRVYTDPKRPDELVRGADIVGTPLAAFETIEAAGDKPGIFNGMCGAESGWVPVSAVSPSLLLSKIEIERAEHDRNRPPFLPAP